ncbi:MAG: hypothetical protein MSG64_20525 [Pyrinomonadaceae bacterium MAG19_C2-C3]|nr:hypothetical protein [Pyrinomonadaceae bacterium MAG19_C2-C3]
MHRLIASLLKAFLVLLEGIFAVTRDRRFTPLYPYDKRTDAITLPSTVRKELLDLVAAGNKVEAVRRVARLTGAGLRTSKNYVDGLQR